MFVSYMFRTSLVRRVDSVVYASFHMHRCEQSGAAHTDACKTYHTAYTTESLRMNPRSLRHVGDNTN
jgi:hypothetical protein